MTETETLEYKVDISTPDEDGVRDITIRTDRDTEESVRLNEVSTFTATLVVTVEFRDGGTVAFVDEDLSMS